MTKNHVGRRFDKFLCSYFALAPKQVVYKLLRKKRIKLNGCRANGDEITALGDKVMFYLSQETFDSFRKPLKNAENMSVLDKEAIVYEDEYILLINKPVGLLTHPSKPDEDSLSGRVARYLNLQGDDFSALCNRLDRNTSGLVACGKDMAAVQALNAIFAKRQIIKTYIAVVCGRLQGVGHLRGYIHKDIAANRSYISKNGKTPVHTEYATLSTGLEFSTVKIILHTGKSHQIRAHFESIGHPLAGDKKYGGKPYKGSLGQMLHCSSFCFLQTDGILGYLSKQTFTTPTPPLFLQKNSKN